MDRRRGLGYPYPMVLNIPQRKILTSVIAQVLTPEQLTMARELAAADAPDRPSLHAEDLMRWMRFNMPVAAQQVEDILHPAD